ncbi:MAG TPA: enoyl-CoA hydratase/isomerase family protein [Oligoflexus sp.]|uniref:enoyl-CoA hydratase/isomerase family protein n=1 Tax=Oligoflexus sp. TaxID=1971216 RepID=UPI002D357D79|nr:enoyl-CoA hydratase/isomerase family protein [Oligoflexus sp.]HYX39802.1 enoyl-CoA hydratase/isomerase family protein [Oligoflexus sp.]
MYISVQKQDSALIWTIRRPDRFNALGPLIGAELLQLAMQLEQELQPFASNQVTEDPHYRCLILRADPVRRGQNPPIWIAGGDLKELAQIEAPVDGRAYASEWARIGLILQDLPIPVLAAIQGAAIGGGAELALAADLRLATRESSLHFKQLEVGLATGYGSCQRLVQLIGQARATDLLLRCRRLSAADAQSIGLINDLAENDEALELLIASVIHDFTRLSAKGLMVQKRMLQGPFVDRKSQWADRELDLFQQLWRHPAHEEFLRNFMKS